MNIMNFAQVNISARLFAGITMLSLLLSAFPVAFFVANAANADAVGDVTLGVIASNNAGPETVTVTFDGTGTLDLTDWTIWDTLTSESKKFTFGSVTLTDGQSYTVCHDGSCDGTSTGGATVWNDSGDTAQLRDETDVTIVATTWGAVTTNTEYTNLESVNYAPAGTVYNVTTDTYFATIEEAVIAAVVNDVIELTDDIEVQDEVVVNKDITIDGLGNIVTTDITFESNSANNSVFEIIGVDGVTLTNFVLEGAGGTAIHGINIYEATNVELTNLTVNDNDKSGVVVNGSEVDVSDFTSTGNGWNAINVALGSGVTDPSVLNIFNTSSHGELAQIWLDDISQDVTVNDEDGQYEIVYEGPHPSQNTTARNYVLKTEEPKKVAICHWHQNGFNAINPAVNSIANAHGNDTEDIIPVIEGSYPTGQNLDTDYNGATGAEVLEAGCVVPDPEPASQCIDIDANLLTNGSFEEPEVTNGSKWQKMASVPGWTVTKVSDSTPTTLELMENIFGNEAADGDQYAELDGDHSTRVTQSVAGLQVGATYELSWAFAGRHNAGADHNKLNVLVDGSSVATEGPQSDPSGLDSEDWTRNSYTFMADSAATEIAFADAGPSNSLGTYLDDAQLCLVEEPELATVTMCKYDEAGNELSNWRLALLGEEVDSLTKNPTAAIQTMTLVPAGEYVLKAEGAYQYRGNTGLLADARFSERKAGDPDFGSYANQPWAESGEPTGYTPGGLAVQVNGDLGALWGSTYSPAHVYYGALTQASTADVDFYIYDSAYGDNVGTIDLALYEGRTGVTGIDGCVTFDDVPYGNYVVEELLQTDWTNISGLGQVAVDTDNVTIDVVNRDPNAPTVTVNATKIVCDYESELPDWSGSIPTVTVDTANDWLAAQGEDTTCRIVPDWEFEWADRSASNPGNAFVGPGGSDWTLFVGSTNVPLAAVNASSFWMREVLPEGYIPFVGGGNGNDRDSAELYCHTDGLNYDNFDRIDGPVDGGEYHCVAWNVPKELPPQTCSIFSDTETLVQDTNQFAVATHEHNNWSADIDDATWVWATARVENPGSEEMYTFVETFTVSNPTSALLDIAADNYYVVTVNGVEVLDRSAYSGNFTSASLKEDIDILPFLNVNGENTIEFKVVNLAGKDDYRKNPAGVLYRLDIESPTACVITTEPKVETMTIDGYKFEVNQYSDEVQVRSSSLGTPVPGWEIALYNQGEFGSEVVVATTATDGTGYYSFEVPVGDYDVYEENPTGWALAYIELNEEFYNSFYCSFDYNVESDTEQYQCDFYNERVKTQILEIYGTKYEGTGEAQVVGEGWEIQLKDSNGDIVATTTTDVDGDYYFVVAPGAYQVHEVMQTDWTQSLVEVSGGSTTTDQDVNYCTFDVYEQQSPSDFRSLEMVDEYPYDEEYECIFTNEFTETVDPEPETTSRSSGTRTRLADAAPAPLVLGASTDTCPFLVDYLQMGSENDQIEVMKLQMFLNIFKDLFGGTENPVTGNFGIITDTNVKLFQETYKAEILEPWFNQGIVGHTKPTGFVYKTTLWKINDIVCPDTAVLPDFTGETLQSNVDLNARAVQD